MHTVTIDGQKTSVYDATLWCSKEFGQTFDVQHTFPGWNWRFTFTDPKQATYFALKWAN